MIIGNGGAEFGVRGYISAYDAETGKLAWRFYTVPGNPAGRLRVPRARMAAKTWDDGEWWKQGGGGTVWDSMAYDPELDLLYVGVGNGIARGTRKAPLGRQGRQPVPVVDRRARPDTGDYVWHYQTTPGETGTTRRRSTSSWPT